MNQINILAIADIHYIGIAEHTCTIRERKCALGLKMILEILNSVRNESIDAIILMGDLVDNGHALLAKEDITSISKALKEAEVPIIVVPGNHDGSAHEVFQIFNDYEGVHDIKGYQIINFADRYNEDNTASRSWVAMDKYFSEIDAKRPVIILQHNPVYPPIDRKYPYNINESEKIMEYYSEKEVLISISGHAHWGIPPMLEKNVGYMTCPALAEDPFRYSIIKFNGNYYEVKERNLAGKK